LLSSYDRKAETSRRTASSSCLFRLKLNERPTSPGVTRSLSTFAGLSELLNRWKGFRDPLLQQVRLPLRRRWWNLYCISVKVSDLYVVFEIDTGLLIDFYPADNSLHLRLQFIQVDVEGQSLFPPPPLLLSTCRREEDLAEDGQKEPAGDQADALEDEAHEERAADWE